MSYLIERLKEPSSYAGFAALLGIVGVKFAPDQFQAIVTLLTAAAGVAAVFMKDKAKE